MATPTPAIPTFTDGTIVHATDLNALASNLTNLYNYNQASFTSQRPCVIAKQTTGQSVADNTDVLVNFNTAPVNTDNMWTASVANQILIQHAGIYLIIGSVRYPVLAGATTTTVCTANIFVNGTVPANAVIGSDQPAVVNGGGPVPTSVSLQNLAVGSTIYLDAWHRYGSTQTLPVAGYGSQIAVIYLTSST